MSKPTKELGAGWVRSGWGVDATGKRIELGKVKSVKVRKVHKPTKEGNAGWHAGLLALDQRMLKRQLQYEADGLLKEAYVMIEARGFIQEHIEMANAREGGEGKK